MRRIKRALISLFLFLIAGTAFSVTPSFEDVYVAFDSLYAGVFSTVASYVAVPRLSLPGVTIESESENRLVVTVSYNRSDLSTYLEIFDMESTAWFSRLIAGARSSLSPLNAVTTQILRDRNFQSGQAILDGTIRVEFSGLSAIRSLIDILVLRTWQNIDFNVYISVMVSGSDISEPLVFEGVLRGKGEGEGSVTLTSENLSCNGIAITLSPITISR